MLAFEWNGNRRVDVKNVNSLWNKTSIETAKHLRIRSQWHSFCFSLNIFQSFYFSFFSCSFFSLLRCNCMSINTQKCSFFVSFAKFLMLLFSLIRTQILTNCVSLFMFASMYWYFGSRISRKTTKTHSTSGKRNWNHRILTTSNKIEWKIKRKVKILAWKMNYFALWLDFIVCDYKIK